MQKQTYHMLGEFLSPLRLRQRLVKKLLRHKILAGGVARGSEQQRRKDDGVTPVTQESLVLGLREKFHHVLERQEQGFLKDLLNHLIASAHLPFDDVEAVGIGQHRAKHLFHKKFEAN